VVKINIRLVKGEIIGERETLLIDFFGYFLRCRAAVGGVEFDEGPIGWVSTSESLRDVTGIYGFSGGGLITDVSSVKSHLLNFDIVSQRYGRRIWFGNRSNQFGNLCYLSTVLIT